MNILSLLIIGAVIFLIGLFAVIAIVLVIMKKKKSQSNVNDTYDRGD